LRWLGVVFESRVWWDVFVGKWRNIVVVGVPVGPRAWKGRCGGSSEHDAGERERERRKRQT
jgi:hypothetical protein